jgi:hypothetical protein
MLLLPVSFVTLDGFLEGVLVSLLPLGWADLSMFVNVLESLDESEDLIDVSSDWKIVV